MASSVAILLWSAMFGEANRVKQMLQEDGLQIDERGPHDFLIPFYPAFGTGGIEAMELLINHGARLEWNAAGATPCTSRLSLAKLSFLATWLAEGWIRGRRLSRSKVILTRSNWRAAANSQSLLAC